MRAVLSVLQLFHYTVVDNSSSFFTHKLLNVDWYFTWSQRENNFVFSFVTSRVSPPVPKFHLNTWSRIILWTRTRAKAGPKAKLILGIFGPGRPGPGRPDCQILTREDQAEVRTVKSWPGKARPKAGILKFWPARARARLFKKGRPFHPCLDHSYLAGKLTSSKTADTEVSEF
jgi:hypothetical protein